MIQITLAENINNYYITANGHYGEKGNSIICASVSVLLETWRLSESILEDQTINYNEGFLEAEVSKTVVSKILFQNLCIGLKAVQKQYPKYVSLNIGGQNGIKESRRFS